MKDYLLMEDRPSYKFVNTEIANMTDSEILSLIIGGEPGNACYQARQILNRCGGKLKNILAMRIDELTNITGIGKNKAISIKATIELAKRFQMEQPDDAKKFGNAETIYNFMLPRIGYLEEEESWVLLLNQNLSLIKAIRLSHGGITETAVDIRLIMKHAVLNNATAIAFAHNHPSNNPNPSRQDDMLTDSIHKACKLMRVHLVDHLIITDGNYYSYKESHKL